jgi:PTH2 family peptidyl-tRNA hydrolase
MSIASSFPPVTLASVSSVALAFGLGYAVCAVFQRWSRGTVPAALHKQKDSDFSDSEDLRAGDGVSDDLKMVLVVRNDLKMTKGKAAAQCCHACLGAYERAKVALPSVVKSWSAEGQPKITLKVDSEEELVQVYSKARAAKLPCYLVQDAGRTQIAAGSKTVVAIGPASNAHIDAITSHLKLY